ncbi:hypothetical protein IP69_06355 [Bosea sp. AAP35]|nr:hypothetical protein IP69_06355 [Bosea sp. AAP35]
MMFMGETPETFISNGDIMLDHIWDRLNQPLASVLDIGCGYGRLAHALARRGFRGRYLGVDVLEKPIAWLQSNFTKAMPAFEFKHIDIHNGRYNTGGSVKAGDFDLDFVDFTPDLVLILSVFTHMYQDDIVSYLNAIRGVSGDNTLVAATFFLTGSPALRSFNFPHTMSPHCRFHSTKDPLHAIAYDETWLRSQFDKVGFDGPVKYWFQDIMFLRPTKPAAG